MPDVAVVIPTHNRAESLRRLLGSLERQTTGVERFEVVVVVDGSTDGTAAMLRELETPLALRVVEQAQSGQHAAVERGVAETGAARLLFLDDDMEASPDLVAAHLRAAGAAPGRQVAVLGRIERVAPPGSGRLARLRSAMFAAHYEGLARREPRFTDCYAGNLSVPRDVWQRLGGFDAGFPRDKDIELGYRLVQSGVTLAYAPDAFAREHSDKTTGDITDFRVRGRAALRFVERHPGALPGLPVGGAGEQPAAWVALRRAALRLHVPLGLFVSATPIVPRRHARAWATFLLSYAYWQGVRESAGADYERFARGVPVLMYHAIGGPGERASRYVVPQRKLDRQLAWLRRQGYRSLTLGELTEMRERGEMPPARSVVLTFDDGYEDNRTLAHPVLRRHGFRATFFLVTGLRAATWAGNEGDAAPLNGRPLMDAGAAARLDGIEIGAHTRTHPRLTELSDDDLAEEVAGSRRDLEHAVGRPVEVFAYPYGAWDERVRRAAERAGFRAACSGIPGRNRAATDTLALRRLEVRGTDSLVRFALTLAAGHTRPAHRRLRRRVR